jgi:hypothetical protein
MNQFKLDIKLEHALLENTSSDTVFALFLRLSRDATDDDKGYFAKKGINANVMAGNIMTAKANREGIEKLSSDALVKSIALSTRISIADK